MHGMCKGATNHGVLVVGYGHDSKSKRDYWIVKNSWGASWGVDGYVKIGAESSNICGILSAPSQP